MTEVAAKKIMNREDDAKRVEEEMQEREHLLSMRHRHMTGKEESGRAKHDGD